MRGAHEAGLDRDRAQSLAAELVVEPFHVVRQPGLGRAVQHHRLARAIARHRREHAERSAAAREQTRARLLAEEQRVREVDREQRLRSSPVSFSSASCGAKTPAVTTTVSKPPSAASAWSSALANPSGRSRSRCAKPTGAAAPRTSRSRRAARQVEQVAPEQEDALAALGHAPREGAAHAARGADEHRLHGASPNRRTDCALRSRAFGSHFRRISFQAAKRGSIARKCSRRREGVLGQIDPPARRDHDLVHRIDERLRARAALRDVERDADAGLREREQAAALRAAVLDHRHGRRAASGARTRRRAADTRGRRPRAAARTGTGRSPTGRRAGSSAPIPSSG